MNPAEFQRSYPQTSKLLQKIINNRQDGSSVLFSQAISGLELLLKEIKNRKSPNLSLPLQYFLKKLVQAHPSMSPFYHLASSFQFPALKKETAYKKLAFWKKYSKTAQRKIIAKSKKIICRNSIILTHSASGTVNKILFSCKNKLKKVYVTESLPRGEGKLFVKQLEKGKIPVHLIKDAMAGQRLKETDLFLIGADAVSKNYFINKKGTKKIAQLAKKQNIPVAVACEKIKFAPKGIAPKIKKSIFEKIPKHLVKYWISDAKTKI